MLTTTTDMMFSTMRKEQSKKGYHFFWGHHEMSSQVALSNSFTLNDLQVFDTKILTVA